MKDLFVRFIREEDGQDMIEYSLLAAFISIVAWMVIQTIGEDVLVIYEGVNTATSDAAGVVPS